MTDALEQIDIMIRARYAILYIVSWEEFRVIEKIRDVLQGNRNIYLWSITRGFRRIEDYKSSGQHNDPVSALNFIQQINDNALFIMSDFHVYLSERNKTQPIVVRLLHELIKDLKESKKTIILLSPILKLPKELEKDINVIDFPLPDQDEIKVIFNNIRKNVKSQEKIDISLDETVYEQIIKALLGLTQNEIENVLYKSLVETRRFSIDVIIREKEQIIRKTGILEYYYTNEKMEYVGGLTDLKKWILKRRNAFKDKARNFGLPYPKGLLLIGIQGCGKSLCCKVIAKLWNFPLLRLDVGAVFESYVGSSESNIRKAITLAESAAPCILWVDEIEKGFSGMASSGRSDAGTTARVFSTFLTWMQEKESSVFIVATANDISLLPPEFIRKGRFDEIFFIDLPNQNEREQIFQIHLEKRNRIRNKFNIKLLAEKTKNFSGAEIESSIIAALYDAFEDNLKDPNQDLNTQHILNEIEKTVPLSITLEERINVMRNWASTRARPASISKNLKKKSDMII